MLRVDVRADVGDAGLDAALAVPAGRTLALAGPSGAGKTSVLRAVAGLLRPRAGRVECDGEVWLDVARGVRLAPEARRCGYVPQDYALFPHLRAWENVAFGMRRAGGRVERRARAEALLERFGLVSRARARARDLSGGERQRVALARALASEPRALLLDEPLSALDARSRAHAARELAELLTAAEVPALLVTHDFAEAAALGDEVAILDGGRVRQQGSPAALAAAPASAFVADFTGASVLEGVAEPGPGGLTLVRLAGGAVLASSERAAGPVAASVFPWEVELAPAGEEAAGGSARNRVRARVTVVTALGNRVRVGLGLPEPLTAEVTAPAADHLGLAPGATVTASWKATATRLAPR